MQNETLLIEVNSAQHSLRINVRYPTSQTCSATLVRHVLLECFCGAYDLRRVL